MFSWVYRHNNPQVIDQLEREHWFGYYIHSEKTWIFDQSERAQGPIYIKKRNNLMIKLLICSFQKETKI